MTAQTKKTTTKYAALKALGNLATITGYLVGIVTGMGVVWLLLDGLARPNYLITLLGAVVIGLVGALVSVAFIALADVINMGLDALALLRKMAFKKDGE